MNASGRTELTTVELPDALEFTVVYENGWLGRLVGSTIAIVVIWMFWRTATLWCQIFACFAAVSVIISLLANWQQGNVTRLRVTVDELLAEGNLDRIFVTTLRIPVSELTSLNWDSGGEGGTAGLHARWSWAYACVMPHIDEQQAQSIRDDIAKRFPEIYIGEGYPHSFLFPHDSGITTLGLSKFRNRDSNTES